VDKAQAALLRPVHEPVGGHGRWRARGWGCGRTTGAAAPGETSRQRNRQPRDPARTPSTAC
jgi:hypothetical protein